MSAAARAEAVPVLRVDVLQRRRPQERLIACEYRAVVVDMQRIQSRVGCPRRRRRIGNPVGRRRLHAGLFQDAAPIRILDISKHQQYDHGP